MRRVLTVLGAALLIFFGGRGLYRTMASDEQKIRWTVEGMITGYNTARPSLCIEPLAEEWRHESLPQLDRELLRGGLFRFSMQERDRKTKELTTRVELVPESLLVSVEDDTADFELEACTSRHVRSELDGERGWEESWRFRVVGHLEKGEGGWKIVSSRHEDLAGTRLSR